MFVALVVAAAVSVPVVVVAVVAAVASAENKLHKTFCCRLHKKRSFIKKQQLKFRFHFETRFISFFSFTRHCATHDEFVTKIPLSSQQTVPSQATKLYRLSWSVTTCGNNRFIVTETFHFIGLKCRALQWQWERDWPNSGLSSCDPPLENLESSKLIFFSFS